MAKECNEKVVLLGTVENSEVCSRWEDIEKLQGVRFEELKEVYVHLSPNSFDYELFCFERYFILQQYMENNQLHECIMVDSDACIYSNLSLLNFEKYDVASSWMYCQDYSKWMIIPHITYWKLSALQDFTSYVIEQYKNNSERLCNKKKLLEQENAAYGISDMSLLYLWVTERCGKFKNLSLIENDETFDTFFSSKYNCNGKNYIMKNGIKKIIFKNRMPYFLTEDGKLIKTHVVHAQGDRKKYIRMLANRKYNILCIKWADFIFFVKKTYQRGKRFISKKVKLT